MTRYVLFLLVVLLGGGASSRVYGQAADLRAINIWGSAQTLNQGAVIPNWSVDVRTKGAVCDGSTDDHVAFNAAIAALPNGGHVLVPATGLGCYLGTGITIGSASISGISLEGVGGTYFPGFADNVQADWTARGSWIICGDTVNACITQSGNGSVIQSLSFWYAQPTPPSATTCSTPCTMTHAWTPTNYPYTILISQPQAFNAVRDVTIVNATNCIDVEGATNGVGSFFTYFEHVYLGCFNSGMLLHRVDNPVELHNVYFNLLWYQASSDVLGYNEGDSTNTGHKVDLTLEYASTVHLSDVTFVQSMTGIHTANETVTNGIGTLTFGAQALFGEGIYFIQDCQAMDVAASNTILQGRFTNVSINTDPQTSTTTQCGGYLPNAFNLASDNVEFGITNLDGLYANTVATIGGGTSGVLHINGASHTTNYSAFTNGLAAFVVASGAALDIQGLNEFLTLNGSAGPRFSGSGALPANWPQTVTGLGIEGPAASTRQACFLAESATGGLSTNQWCWNVDSAANMTLQRFDATTGAFVDNPIGIATGTGIVSFNDGIDSTGYQIGGTAGVSCIGAPTAGFASVNGLVTHC